MIKIYVCTQCESRDCCDFEDGIKMYEFINSYMREYFPEIEVEINVTTCNCLSVCKGPVVKVNDKVYINVNRKKAIEIIKDIATDKK